MSIKTYDDVKGRFEAVHNKMGPAFMKVIEAVGDRDDMPIALAIMASTIACADAKPDRVGAYLDAVNEISKEVAAMLVRARERDQSNEPAPPTQPVTWC